jgi:hypothetical protein
VNPRDYSPFELQKITRRYTSGAHQEKFYWSRAPTFLRQIMELVTGKWHGYSIRIWPCIRAR